MLGSFPVVDGDRTVTHQTVAEKLIREHDIDVTDMAREMMYLYWGKWGRGHFRRKHNKEEADRARWLYSLVRDPNPELMEINALMRIEIGDWSLETLRQISTEETAVVVCNRLLREDRGTLTSEEALRVISFLRDRRRNNLRDQKNKVTKAIVEYIHQFLKNGYLVKSVNLQDAHVR